ncbi:MAG: potassium-transporting ATPase subunit KdpA [Planctomycetes bacterium]|nr:potassium-transporting ATPase subunit KdpA [Planctomycetota bacterium]
MGWLQSLVYVVALTALAVPLGEFMARVYLGRATTLARVLGPLERLTYRAAGVREEDEMGWKRYGRSVLVFSVVGFLFVFLLQRLQPLLPLNPAAQTAVSPDSSFNTAVSFVTNTNWQGYSGEQTLSHLTQTLALGVQNFVSAATGMAILVALIRGFTRRTSHALGNFWIDLTRSTLYILLPLSAVLALILVSQGVVQNFDPPAAVELTDPLQTPEAAAVTQQFLSQGPAASQVAIKQLGTNGGGFFNANSAHPFENPTPLSNFLEALGILLIPAGLCFTFGAMVGDRRQGVSLFAAMLLILVPAMGAVHAAEQAGTPALAAAGLDLSGSDDQPGGNMEGKELRFGIAGSALWAVATTAASNGSVNSMHDSYTPLGGLVPLLLMQLGEVVFGGVGSGLYGMLMFVIVAVFIAGLMVGRTPEYLGKKIGAFEMKMASLAILGPCFAALLGTAIAVAFDSGRIGVANPGAHGFSEILYAFSSAGNNNGSAFAGLSANTPFYNTALGLAMLVGRFLPALAALAIAGSLAAKRSVPAGAGTLATHDGLFVLLLVGVVLLVGALTFVPALALGPIVEHLGAAH